MHQYYGLSLKCARKIPKSVVPMSTLLYGRPVGMMMTGLNGQIKTYENNHTSTFSIIPYYYIYCWHTVSTALCYRWDNICFNACSWVWMEKQLFLDRLRESRKAARAVKNPLLLVIEVRKWLDPVWKWRHWLDYFRRVLRVQVGKFQVKFNWRQK